MLESFDKALAGAIDVVADDIQATIKSVREQGVKAAFKDYVEDAAGKVVSGAGSMLSGVVSGNSEPERISAHSGVSSSYADLCARSAPSTGSAGHNGAAFAYTGPAPPRSQQQPSFASGGFAPGVGIQRPSVHVPGPVSNGAGLFSGISGSAASHPPPNSASPKTDFMTSSTPSDVAASRTSSDRAPIPAELLASRLDTIRQREPANRSCFDCGAAFPEWASVSFGVFICIECGGHHRSMGTHISRVRSCKMDSWTETQLQVFDHGGNQRLGDFFAANRIDASGGRFQRYCTPAAEWYRESWMKNRLFNRPVPAPPPGVAGGPCTAKGAGRVNEDTQSMPPSVNLLDFDGSSSSGAPVAPAQADLLGFDDQSCAGDTTQSADADLLGVSSISAAPQGSGGADLLGFSDFGCSPSKVSNHQVGGDLVGVMTAQLSSPMTANFGALNLNSTAAPPLLSSPSSLHPNPSHDQVLTALREPALQQSPTIAMGKTLGAGAKYQDAPKDEKSTDPFAMALQRWNM